MADDGARDDFDMVGYFRWRADGVVGVDFEGEHCRLTPEAIELFAEHGTDKQKRLSAACREKEAAWKKHRDG